MDDSHKGLARESAPNTLHDLSVTALLLAVFDRRFSRGFHVTGLEILVSPANEQQQVASVQALLERVALEEVVDVVGVFLDVTEDVLQEVCRSEVTEVSRQ